MGLPVCKPNGGSEVSNRNFNQTRWMCNILRAKPPTCQLFPLHSLRQGVATAARFRGVALKGMFAGRNRRAELGISTLLTSSCCPPRIVVTALVLLV